MFLGPFYVTFLKQQQHSRKSITFCVSTNQVVECENCRETLHCFILSTVMYSSYREHVVCKNCIPRFATNQELTFKDAMDYDVGSFITFILSHPIGLEISPVWFFEVGKRLFWNSVLQPKASGLKNHFEFGKFCVDGYVNTRIISKLSIDTFCMCLARLNVCADVRFLIVKLIWPNEIICWLQEE